MDEAASSMPRPFWSEELQRQYLETVESENRQRPADLANYEAQEERRGLSGDEAELEPPYGADPDGPRVMAVPTQFLDVCSGGSEAEPAERAVESPVPLLARMEERAEASPSGRSQARESEHSVRTAQSK